MTSDPDTLLNAIFSAQKKLTDRQREREAVAGSQRRRVLDAAVADRQLELSSLLGR